MLVVVAALPLLVAATRLVPLLSSGWTPVRDDALLELRTADVGTRPVLLGPYSRFGWHHPGPSLFYVLAVPYRLLGRSSVALPLTAVAINLGAVAGMAALAWRRGGRALLLALLLVLEVYLATLGPWALRSAWNPTVSILPFALLVLLVWSATCGDAWCLPLAAGVGSFVVQAHIGYAAAVLVVALVGSVLSLRAPGGPGLPSRQVGLALAVLTLLWLPPVVDQLANDPGNLGVMESSLRSAEPSLTPIDGARVAIVRLGAIPAWLGRTGADLRPDGTGGALLPGALTCGVLLVAGLVARHRRRDDRVRLAVLTAATIAACAWTAGRIEGEVEAWLVTWMSVPGLVAWTLAVWMALDRLVRRPRGGAVALVAGAVMAVVALGNAGAAQEITLWRRGASGTVTSLVGQLEPALRREDRAPLMTFGPRASHVSPMGWGAGMVLALEKRDVEVRVDPRWRLQFGEERTDTRGTGMRLLVTTDRRYEPTSRQALLAEADGVLVYGSG